MTQPLLTVSESTSAKAIAGLMQVCFPDARTVLDMTWGRGLFWTNANPDLRIVGSDLVATRHPDLLADFRHLPFQGDSFDVAVFDPPYHTDMGRTNASVMGSQFGHYPTLFDLKEAITQGVGEAARISRLGYIVKCQDYIHGQRAIWMSEWVRQAAGRSPYDFLITQQPRKLIDPKWQNQFSVWRNHSVYWVFRHGDQRHRQRGFRSH